MIYPTVDGFWSEWSPTDASIISNMCSATCGTGTFTQTRTCTQPKHGGEACPADDDGNFITERTEECNQSECPGQLQTVLF